VGEEAANRNVSGLAPILGRRDLVSKGWRGVGREFVSNSFRTNSLILSSFESVCCGHLAKGDTYPCGEFRPGKAAAGAVEEAGEGVAWEVAGRDGVGVAEVVRVGHWKKVYIRLGFLAIGWAGITRGLPECMEAPGETGRVWDSLQVVERQ